MIEIILLAYAGACLASTFGQWLSVKKYQRLNRPLNIEYSEDDVSLAIRNIKTKLGNNIFYDIKSRKMEYNKDKKKSREVMLESELEKLLGEMPEEPKEIISEINWEYYQDTNQESTKELIKSLSKI